MSWSLPTAMNFPSLTAAAWANERRSSCVAILPWWTITSAVVTVPVRLSAGMVVPPWSGLVGRLEQALREGRLAVDHRVGVLDALPVSAGMLNHYLHDGIVGLLARPVPLELQQDLL